MVSIKKFRQRRTEIGILISFIMIQSLISVVPALSTVIVGQKAPDFSLTDSRGNIYSLADSSGKVVVLFFVGYDCGSCLVEAPEVERNIYQKYRKHGVCVWAIDIWNGSSYLVETRFRTPTQINFPVLLFGGDVGQTFGTNVSNYVVIDQAGKVTYISRFYDPKGLQDHLDSLAKISSEINPATFRLDGNYPNPFNPITRIRYQIFSLPSVSVVLNIYNELGETIRTLVDTKKVAGIYEQTWDGRNAQGQLLPAGVYFIRLEVGNSSEFRKMILLR